MLGSKGSTKLLMEDQTGRGGWTMLGEPCMPELGLGRWAKGKVRHFKHRGKRTDIVRVSKEYCMG